MKPASVFFDGLLSSSYPSLSVLPHCALDLPQNAAEVHSLALADRDTYTQMHLAGQVRAVVREMVFHLDPRKAEARVQLIGFQRVNEKGNKD